MYNHVAGAVLANSLWYNIAIYYIALNYKQSSSVVNIIDLECKSC